MYAKPLIVRAIYLSFFLGQGLARIVVAGLGRYFDLHQIKLDNCNILFSLQRETGGIYTPGVIIQMSYIVP